MFKDTTDLDDKKPWWKVWVEDSVHNKTAYDCCDYNVTVVAENATIALLEKDKICI